MSFFATMTGRQRVQMLGLALLAVVGLVATLLVVLPVVAAALLVMALLALATVVMRQTAAAVEVVGRAVSPESEPAPAAPVQLELATGEVVSARPVRLTGPSEHTMLLTRDGYLVVDEAGRVLRRIGGTE